MERFVTGDDTQSFYDNSEAHPSLGSGNDANNGMNSFTARRWEYELAREMLSEDKWARAAAGRLPFPL